MQKGDFRIKEKVKHFLKSKKGGQVLFIVGIVGIVLIYFSGVAPKNNKKTEEAEIPAFSREEYTAYLEQQVREIVAAISGDTSAVVTVTLDSELTYVYAEDKKENNKTEESEESRQSEKNYIIVRDSDGSEKPLIVTTKLPEVRGVAIVCGPVGEETRDKIQSAVMAALKVTSREVYIANRVYQ